MVPYPSNPILMVDDEEQILLSVGLTLKSAGINNFVKCADSRKVMPLLAKQEFSLVLLDMMMPELSGEELVRELVSAYPHVPLLIITAMNKVETAVECMKLGALDYIVKPVDDARLVTTIKRALELGEVRAENTRLKQYLLFDNLEDPEAFSEVVTRNPTMRAIFQYIEAIARTVLPVLITGETGVGKEMIAQSIHRLSHRSGNFVAVNTAGLDDNLVSDTLFGHKKGAFTGAERDRKGLIESAEAGTLFLDEIGDLSPESQIKLLRLLQERSYYPLGSDMPRFSDARIVAATNQSLEELQANGKFRKDLYYRLKAHHIHIPALRERLDDIPLLIEHFLEKAAAELGKKRPTVPREIFTLLRTYHFPGNLRQLQAMIYDAVSQHKSGILSMTPFKSQIADEMKIGAAVLPSRAPNGRDSSAGLLSGVSLPTLKDAEEMLIQEALRRADGNQTIAAQLLGMSRKALNNRLIRSRK